MDEITRLARRRLPVRVRRTLAGDGGVDTEMSVFCPLRGLSVPLSSCTTCDHCSKIGIDTSENEWGLVCNAVIERPLTAVHELDGRSEAGRIAVSTVMKKNVTCVRPDVRTTSLLSMLLERGFSGLPVVDEDGYPIGMVSKTDLLRQQDEQPECVATEDEAVTSKDETTVEDIMTAVAFTVPEQASLSQAAAMMSFEGVHRVPIVSEEGQVVGILSALDIARWLAQQDGYVVA